MAIIAANTGILRGKEEAKDTPSKSFLFSIDSQTSSQNSLPECASVLNPAEPVYSIFRGEIYEEIAMNEILIQRGAHGIAALGSAAAAAFMASCNPEELCNIQDKDKERYTKLDLQNNQTSLLQEEGSDDHIAMMLR
ncbi:unnamed protein product [Sphagnum tenellum]